MTEVSVIIPSYKSSRTLYKCLRAVTQQSTHRQYEVIVVHSGSEPIPQEIIDTFYNSVSFHVFETRWLPGKARNWAVKRVISPWILFLDSDCIVGENWIESILSEAIRQNADAAGGSVRNATPWDLISWTMHLLEFGRWLPGYKQKSITNFPSCNALYKRSILLEVGGFLENLFPCEDTVLNHLLDCKGYHLIFIPESIVSHIHRKNITRLLQHNYMHGLAYGRASQIYNLPGSFLCRFPRSLAIVIVMLVRFIRVALRLIPRHIIALFLLLISTPLVLLSLAAWGIGFKEACTYQFLREHVGQQSEEVYDEHNQTLFRLLFPRKSKLEEQNR